MWHSTITSEKECKYYQRLCNSCPHSALTLFMIRYHFALIVSSKQDPNNARRYHATNKLQMRDGQLKSTWEYEHLPLPLVKVARLLVKVLIGKVKTSREDLERSLAKVPVVQDVNILSY